MAIKNYLCGKCGSLTKAKSSPDGLGCTKGGAFHKWRDLGEEGDKGFYCESCNTAVHVNERPTMFGCPGDDFHTWKGIF